MRAIEIMMPRALDKKTANPSKEGQGIDVDNGMELLAMAHGSQPVAFYELSGTLRVPPETAPGEVS